MMFLVITMTSCTIWQKAKYRKSDRKEMRLVKSNGGSAHMYHVKSGGFTMRVMVAGDSGLPVILLIHGSPGSIATYNRLLTDTSITNHLRLVAVDRPGYGYSRFGHADTSVLKQTELILHSVYNFLPKDSYSVTGYSFGGPIAATIAGLDSNRVKKLVLVSPALGPGLEKTYGISHLIDKPLFRWMFPKVLRVANDEKLTHCAALEKVIPYYHHIRAHVLFFHGTTDGLIYATNMLYASQMFSHAASLLFKTKPGPHHAYFWKSEDLFKQEFRRFLIP